ncbi:MAG: hypothetical protein QG668_376 [Patescibacteria group bacterium]|nr:hypothetical protein [Patescibacteria group bacterium]
MQDGFDALGYRSANVAPDTGTGKPLREHGEGRRCKCGARLSTYNPGLICRGACISPDRRRVLPQIIPSDSSSEPANQSE